MIQELIDTRKGVLDYQESIHGKLNKITEPLHFFNIDQFGYGKFFLDERQLCDSVFWLDNRLDLFTWYCMNAYDIGLDFTKAMRETSFNARNYFIFPFLTDCPIIKAFRDLYGVKSGIIIYIRFCNYIEIIQFTSTQQNSILSSNTLNVKTIEIISKYVKFFKLKINTLEINEKNVVKYMNKIDLSEQTFPAMDRSNFLNSIEIKKHPIEIGNKSIVLSKREWECLQTLSKGQTIKETAVTLNLSPRTIESHLDRIKLKTGCRFKSDLIKVYQENCIDFFGNL